jgi:hypothetical protein
MFGNTSVCEQVVLLVTIMRLPRDQDNGDTQLPSVTKLKTISAQ